ncbi:MAG: class GN sortase, partial [Pseudomonadales bacterium]
MSGDRMELRNVLALVTVMFSVGLFCHGGYIHAKAILAQWLIADSWQDTLAGQASVRPWPWADTWPVAALRVPRLDIEQYVLAGDSGQALAFGPGHHSASSLPGSVGTTLISGHRDTHFSFVRDLVSGDTLELQGPDGGSLRYRITHMQVVDSRQALWFEDTS